MRIALTLFVIATVSGCASSPAGSSAPVPRLELTETGASNVYEALEILRPRWLQRTVDAPEMGVVRRRGAPPPPDNARYCTAMAYIGAERARGEHLQSLPVLRVFEVRLIPARAVRPDGSRCTHDRPAIHVVLVDATP